MVAFTLGNFSIHRYGIFYFISFIVGYFFLKYIGHTKLFQKRPKLQNLLEKNTEDIILFALIGVIVGGRLGHVFIYDFKYYLAHIQEILHIRKGGMSFVGSMIGVSIAFLVFKKIKKLDWTDFLLLFDCILAIVPFGIMIGRFGNFLNQELYGIPVPSGFVANIGYPLFSLFHDLHIFHVYSEVDTILRINTNFLAMFFEGFLILTITLTIIYHRIKKKIYYPGLIAGIFLITYSIVRFFLEYLRADSQQEYLGICTKSQRFFLGFLILGIFIIIQKIYLTKKNK